MPPSVSVPPAWCDGCCPARGASRARAPALRPSHHHHCPTTSCSPIWRRRAGATRRRAGGDLRGAGAGAGRAEAGRLCRHPQCAGLPGAAPSAPAPPPDLARLCADLQATQPQQLRQEAQAAAESLRQLLTTLETRDGILDRRFYASCQRERADELCALLTRAGLAAHPLRGRTLRLLLLAAALGGSPAAID